MSKYIEEAGAVLIRERQGNIEILLEYRDRSYHDWTFPKGNIEKNETIEETAVRELKEETGYTIKIIKKLPNVYYEWEKGKVRQHMFLAQVIDGHLTPEFKSDRLKWFSIDEAVEKLTHKNLKNYLKSIKDAI